MIATSSPAVPGQGLSYHATAAVTDAPVGMARIAILDCGAQYGKVIDRRLRENNVYCDLLPLNTPAAELTGYQAIVISGGPQSVYGPAAPAYDPELFNRTLLPIPILGICYGMQLINHVFHGTVSKGSKREDGQFTLDIDNSCPLFHGLSTETEVLLTHGDSVDVVAPGFTVVARSRDGIVAAIADQQQQLYGVQFHPEVDLTVDGKQMFLNFIERIAQLPRLFTLASRQETAIAEIRATVGNSNVLVLVSGGVDSSVCAALLYAALDKKQIYALHIDNGFMRLNESRDVAAALLQVGLNLKVVDASQQFYAATTSIDGVVTDALSNTLSPEAKRKIIGDTFMHVADAHALLLQLKVSETFLAQGTLRPDLIESASSLASATAEVIKTHHNDTALVRALRAEGRIIEPLRDLHKDEVRALGMELGLPEQQVWRQPFPGPGLAIRIICADAPYTTADDGSIQQQLQEKFRTEVIRSVLLPCRTVGVQGDGRSYKALVALSSVADNSSNSSSSSDDQFSLLSATRAVNNPLAPAHIHMPSAAQWQQLFAFAKQIPKTIHGVNRVIYAFGQQLQQQADSSSNSSSLYGNITPTRLQPDAIKQLQLADAIVTEVLIKYNLNKRLSQVPVILFPCDFSQTADSSSSNSSNGSYRSICIRTFITNDFMTGVPAVPTHDITALQNGSAAGIGVDALMEIVHRIYNEVPFIARVCYDLTGKPPATTEWE